MESKFQAGDKVIWLVPVDMVVEDSGNYGCRCLVINEKNHHLERGGCYCFDHSGGYVGGSVESDGCIVHPGFKVESGKEPDRCPFKDKDLVLVRYDIGSEWVIAAFKSYFKDVSFQYYTYGGFIWKDCIPYAGNEDKLGKVTA